MLSPREISLLNLVKSLTAKLGDLMLLPIVDLYITIFFLLYISIMPKSLIL